MTNDGFLTPVQPIVRNGPPAIERRARMHWSDSDRISELRRLEQCSLIRLLDPEDPQEPTAQPPNPRKRTLEFEDPRATKMPRL